MAGTPSLRALKIKIRDHFPKKFARRVGGVIATIIGTVILGVLSTVVWIWIQDWFVKEIVIVGVDENRSWKDIKEGVKEYREQHEQILEELKIKVRLVNHEGNLLEAQKEAQQLMADGRVVAVVLGGTSSQVETLLKYYRGEKPVLLAVSSNPHLALSDNVFRLPPNDKKQVDALTQFAKLHFSQPIERQTKIMILRDHSNETYSRYVADNVRDNLDQLNLSIGADQDGNMRIQIVADGEIAGHNEGIHVSADFVQSIRPDVIFYAGNGHRLLPLIHQAADFGGWLPVLALTNGSVNSEFLQLAEGRFQAAYATFPLFPKEGWAAPGRPDWPDGWGDSPSYKPYGYDALALLLDAIREMNSQNEIDKETKVPTADQLVEGLKHVDYQGLAGNYSFKNGENTEGQFHIYHAVNGGPPDFWHWEHSSSDCPQAP
jgi:ABC-type branched-subunit amino acid transport system substrate-binding protein